jgi:ribosomal protein L29
MSTNHSIKDIRAMQQNDLVNEIEQKRTSLAKMRLGLEMRSFKDSAQFRRGRKELARMLTVLGTKEVSAPVSEKTALKAKPKKAKVSAPRSK